jgi:hypothetical protein
MTEPAAAYITAPPPPRESGVVYCPMCGQPMLRRVMSHTTGEPCLDGLENVTIEGARGHAVILRHKGCGGIKEYTF